MSYNVLSLSEGNLAAFLDVNDIQGFFSTEVEVMPGVKALVYENGNSVGEINAGRYTLKSFSDSLKFWTEKNMKLFIVKASEFGITYTSRKFQTKEGLLVSGKILVNYSLRNSALFHKNLVGSSISYTLEDFARDTQFIVMAALQKAIYNFSIKELGLPNFNEYVATSMETAVQDALSRYGIRFSDLQILSLQHEEFDKLQQRKSDLWIVKENQKIQDEETQQKLDERLTQISFTEKSNELDVLAAQIAADREDGEIAVIRRRYAQKSEMRKIIQAAEFDKIASQAEMEQVLFENEKAKDLRESEREELKKIIEAENCEMEMRRENLLEKLGVQLEHEMLNFQREYEYNLKLEALDREAELAKRAESEAGRAWLVHIQQEKAARAEEKEKLKDASEIQTLAGNLAYENQTRENRLCALKRENDAAEEVHRSEMLKQKDLWMLEMQSRTFTNQLEKMMAVQKLNQAQDLFEMDLYERKLRLEAEIRLAEKNGERMFELDKIRLYKEFGPNGIFTLLNPEQANAFIAAQESQGKNMAAAAANAAFSAEMKGRYEEQEKANDKMTAMFREFMAQQERTANLMAQMHIQTPQTAPVIVGGVGVPGNFGSNSGSSGNSSGSGSSGKRVLLCPGCKSEVGETARFCPNCGKPL